MMYAPILVFVCCEEVADLSLPEIYLVVIVTFDSFFLIDVVVQIMEIVLETQHRWLSANV